MSKQTNILEIKPCLTYDVNVTVNSLVQFLQTITKNLRTNSHDGFVFKRNICVLGTGGHARHNKQTHNKLI